jgi:hypothetical protein
MAAVPLVFNLPGEEGLTSMNIYEATSADGPWTLIETVTEIGMYPDYIHEYITNNAQSAVHWFSISVVDEALVESELSVPMQGGTTTLVSEITQRVMQRGVSLSESVVIQEAEAVISHYYGKDPYTVDPATVSYNVKAALTYLTLARSLLVVQAAGSGATSGWTAGLVSMKSATETTQSTKSVEWLMSEAQKLLGLGFSRVAQIVSPDYVPGVCGLPSKVIEYNISRLQVTSIG